MSSPTIDIAIAAWKGATTEAHRDLAAEAIEQHIAHDTPEGGDYEYATAEFIDRLKAECGPLPEPDTRTFFIAVPANDQAAGIYGIGLTEEDALRDAYRESNSTQPTVRQDEWQHWIVTTGTGKTTEFLDEGDAIACAKSHGFVARPCTERLYDHVDDHGCDAATFRWDQSGALDDLLDDEAGVYDGATLLDDEDRLPSLFTYRDRAGGITRYWYQGQETYDVHDYDAEREIWIGRGTVRFEDDDTVGDFLVSTGEL